MKLEVKMISTQMVTPSSPTPPHLKIHNLSFLDQIMPPHLIISYLIYPNDNNNLTTNAQKSTHLKKSLSQALTLFYPLAGRRVGNSHIDCNDEGVTYVEAQTDRRVSDLIMDPDPEVFGMLLQQGKDPSKCSVDSRDLCPVVQATFFSCGGLVLGLGISHKICDGFSVIMFLKSWAAFSRGECRVKSPIFESAILFPPNNSVRVVRELTEIEEKRNVVTKRFVFTSKKIAELKNNYKGLSTRISRFETLLAFIGNRYFVATKKKGARKVNALRSFVDIRTRVAPPLSEYHFGNFVAPAIITMPSLKNGQNVTNGIIKQMQDAIHDVDGDSVAMLREWSESIPENEVVMLSFTNFYGFPVQEVNFGWGIPRLIGGPNHLVNNMVFFNNSLSCEGIDIWVNLKEEDMTKFEADEELLEYISCGDTKFMSKI